MTEPKAVTGEGNAPRGTVNTELLEALKGLQNKVREYRLLDVKKRYSLCVADAVAGTAIHNAQDYAAISKEIGL